MELDKFVAQTLTMISKGVRDAKSNCSEFDAIVNDSPSSMNPANGMFGSNDSILQTVEFDVAIITEDASEGEGKISVMGIGFGGGTSSKDTYTSRVKFNVPISFSKTE